MPLAKGDAMGSVGTWVSRLVLQRRNRVLTEALSKAIPDDARTVLDVGCGDGEIARMLRLRRPNLNILGADLCVCPDTRIPVAVFDGARLPFLDGAFDVVMFVDALHHSDDPAILLREAKRVSRGSVVLKDRISDHPVAEVRPSVMDRLGNMGHGVRKTYHAWTGAQWRRAFEAAGLSPQSTETRLGLYPFPTSLIFDRGLHFVSRLAV